MNWSVSPGAGNDRSNQAEAVLVCLSYDHPPLHTPHIKLSTLLQNSMEMVTQTFLQRRPESPPMAESRLLLASHEVMTAS